MYEMGITWLVSGLEGEIEVCMSETGIGSSTYIILLWCFCSFVITLLHSLKRPGSHADRQKQWQFLNAWIAKDDTVYSRVMMPNVCLMIVTEAWLIVSLIHHVQGRNEMWYNVERAHEQHTICAYDNLQVTLSYTTLHKTNYSTRLS